MAHSPKLISVATAVPGHVFGQDEVAAAAAAVFSPRISDYRRMSGVFASAGIRKRHLVQPMSWYLQPQGWPERAAVYYQGARTLFVEASRRALDAAGLCAGDVDTVVAVSSTGIATPSLEARAAIELGLRSDVQRVPIFGLGCAGGVSGLSIAAQLARGRPGSNVLLVAVELCSMAFQLDDASKANIVASALFGDGAAACVLRCEAGGLAEVEAWGEHIWPDTLDIMGWDVGERGLGVIFQKAIPPFAQANMGQAVAGILRRCGLETGDVDRFICHPGGAKVIAALETALSLNQGSLDLEREVLADYGNMSAPTVLFVLERALRRELPPRSALVAMGPGFSASCAVLKRAA